MGRENTTNIILQKTMSESLPRACRKGLSGSIIFMVKILSGEKYKKRSAAGYGAP
jgi:hypothetical protein